MSDHSLRQFLATQLADIQSKEYMAKVTEEISEMVFAMIKNERNNPDSQAFYEANKLN